jgi:preprotein translocase subunit SecF
MLNIVGKRYLWFLVSLIIILPGMTSLVINGVQLGIDFTGGTLWEIQTEREVTTGEVQDVLVEQGFTTARVQTSEDAGEHVVLIRMDEVQQGSEIKAQLDTALREQIGEFTELRLESVGPTLGTEIQNRAMMAVGLASVGVLLYIAYAFRNTQNAFLYGACAIIAMLHDVALVIGAFSILG